MQPQFQFANMPTASASNLGFVYQYTGATGTYTQDMFYRCVYDSDLGEYSYKDKIKKERPFKSLSFTYIISLEPRDLYL